MTEGGRGFGNRLNIAWTTGSGAWKAFFLCGEGENISTRSNMGGRQASVPLTLHSPRHVQLR